MNRRGIALLLVMGFLIILGGLTASAFALAAAERKAGGGAVAAVQAQAAAEGAMALALAGWSKAILPGPVGEETALTSFLGAGGAIGRATLRSLGGPIFAIRAIGHRASAGGIEQARAALELYVRLDSAGTDTLIHPRAIPRAWGRFFP